MSVDDSDYRAGFEEGYRLIKGKTAYLPHIPHQPHTPHRLTAFRVGLKKGIERAGAKIVDD